jgi:hypothetical protein
VRVRTETILPQIRNGGRHAFSGASEGIDGTRANTIDAGEGSGPTFKKIAERFKPQSFCGNPTRREGIMVVELETHMDVAELMYALIWFAGNEPTFTPLIKPEFFDEALTKASASCSRRNSRSARRAGFRDPVSADDSL